MGLQKFGQTKRAAGEIEIVCNNYLPYTDAFRKRANYLNVIIFMDKS